MVVLPQGTRKEYSGLDEGKELAILLDEEPPKKKRGRPPGIKSPKPEGAIKEPPPKKRIGRPPKAALPIRVRPLEAPSIGEEQLAQWRQQLDALPDDADAAPTPPTPPDAPPPQAETAAAEAGADPMTV